MPGEKSRPLTLIAMRSAIRALRSPCTGPGAYRDEVSSRARRARSLAAMGYSSSTTVRGRSVHAARTRQARNRPPTGGTRKGGAARLPFA